MQFSYRSPRNNLTVVENMMFKKQRAEPPFVILACVVFFPGVVNLNVVFLF